MAILGEDFTMQAMLGPFLANAYFENLLYEGQPVQYFRQGSISLEGTILDAYEVTAPGMTEPRVLYVDQYSQDYYRVPKGFECTGLMFPELFLEDEE